MGHNIKYILDTYKEYKKAYLGLPDSVHKEFDYIAKDFKTNVGLLSESSNNISKSAYFIANKRLTIQLVYVESELFGAKEIEIRCFLGDKLDTTDDSDTYFSTTIIRVDEDMIDDAIKSIRTVIVLYLACTDYIKTHKLRYEVAIDNIVSALTAFSYVSLKNYISNKTLLPITVLVLNLSIISGLANNLRFIDFIYSTEESKVKKFLSASGEFKDFIKEKYYAYKYSIRDTTVVEIGYLTLNADKDNQPLHYYIISPDETTVTKIPNNSELVRLISAKKGLLY